MVRRYTASHPNLRARMPDFIVLASSSPYRRQMLDRLRLPFEWHAPDVDEAGRPGEMPLQLACRLALLKASTVAVRYPEAIVIGSDQVAEMDGLAIGKPGGHQDALPQLVAMQGRTVVFHTALAVVRRSDGRTTTDCVDTWVRFRRLQPDALERYLRLEQPYDCAGSAKIESLGICLVESVRSDDPTALIGLPLISLTSMLAGFGVALPAR
jgi:septum formation protein